MTEAHENNIYMGQSDYGICNTIITNSDTLQAIQDCLLFSSTLLRARQTTDYIVTQFPSIQFTVKLLPDLIERGLGEFEGKEKYIIRQNSDFFDNGNLKFELTPPNGEAFYDFHLRVRRAHMQIQSAACQGDVLVISHLQVLRMFHFLDIENNTDYSKWYDINYKHGEMVLQ